MIAAHDQPPADVSAMDGYAVAEGSGPWRVTGEVAAGARDAGMIGPGEAHRIFTGAMLPAGADAVVIQEAVVRDGDTVALARPGIVAAGANVRRRGLDFVAGAALGGVGVPLTPARIGLAAAMGHATLPVHRRPVVALLATGDELVRAGTVPGPGAIVDAARPMLGALVAPAAELRDLGIARDDMAALGAAFGAAAGADILVTIGGASVGDHDLVRRALLTAGGSLDFWRVAIRPGKPMLVGRLGDTIVLGLPGNPASAFVTATLFLVPLVRAMLGFAAPIAAERAARLMTPLPANDARRDHLRAVLRWEGGARWVTPARLQDSALLTPLAAADALIVRPIGAPAAAAGQAVDVLDTDSPWA